MKKVQGKRSRLFIGIYNLMHQQHDRIHALKDEKEGEPFNQKLKGHPFLVESSFLHNFFEI